MGFWTRVGPKNLPRLLSNYPAATKELAGVANLRSSLSGHAGGTAVQLTGATRATSASAFRLEESSLPCLKCMRVQEILQEKLMIFRPSISPCYALSPAARL